MNMNAFIKVLNLRSFPRVHPNKAGLFEGSLFWVGINLTPFFPALYFKKYLSNINITLYNS